MARLEDHLRVTDHISRPTPGTYQMRFVKGGVQVPVLIWRPCACTINGPDEHHWQGGDDYCDRYGPLVALVDGWEDRDPLTVWNSCRRISREEYDFLVERHEWARKFDPNGPEANPHRPVDLTGMQSLM